MVIKVTDQYEVLYHDIISLLSEVKVTEGPQAVSSTLRRHPKVRDFLKHYQSEKIIDIEEEMDYA